MDSAAVGRAERGEGMRGAGFHDGGFDALGHRLKNGLTLGAVTTDVDGDMEVVGLAIVNYEGEDELERVEGGGVAADVAAGFRFGDQEGDVDHVAYLADFDLIFG